MSNKKLNEQIKKTQLNSMNYNTLRAKSAIYNWHYKLLLIDFVNGSTVAIPVSEIKGLIDPNKDFPSIKDLQPELVSDGRDLHWEILDYDIHICDLIVNMFKKK